MTTIDKPGIYVGIPESVYHSDPCPAPSLSNSIAKILYNQTPGHAWWAHPRLNRSKALEIEQSTKTQLTGTVLHALILGQGRPIKVLSHKDYKTNAAKEARDKAIEAGEVPILEHAMIELEATARNARARIAQTDIADLFDEGEAEVTMVWQEDNGVWCRARIDWLPAAARDGGHIIVPDIKTASGSAHPDAWQRTMFDFGADIQAAFYERGLRKLIPNIRSVEFPFVVIEQEEPNAVSVCKASNEALEMAHDVVDLAIRSWGELLKKGTSLEHWPFYDTGIAVIDPPVWRKMAGELLRMRMQDRIAHWQRPLDMDAPRT
jgi:hypothetical protein